MSRPNQRTQKPKKFKAKETKEVDSSTLTITQVSLTKYITQMDSSVQPTNKQGTKTDSKKLKKNSGENPPDKQHHESEDIQEGIMNVNPQNSQHKLVNTQNNPLWVDEQHVTTENLQDKINTMEQRLSISITNNVMINVTQNLQGTINSFDTTLRTAMESMTSAVNQLIKSNEAMIKQKE